MNEYAQLDIHIEAHPKYKRLARVIGRDPLGYLAHLMISCGNHYPDGLVPEDLVEDACNWDGASGLLLTALLDTRICDRADDGRIRYHGWDERSGEALTDIRDKHEERRAADRARKAAKKAADAAKKAAEEQAERDLDAGDPFDDSAEFPPGSAPFRSIPQDSAAFRSTETETNSKTDPDPGIPPVLNVLPLGQRAGAGASARVETEREARSVERLQAGVRKTWKGKHPDDRGTLLELVRGCPPDWSIERYTERLLELMRQVAASGEYGTGPLPESRRTKYVVGDAAAFLRVHREALVMFPSRLPPPPTLADRNRWESDRQTHLELEQRQPGKRLTPEQLAAIAAQVHAEADVKFGPIARAGPAAPAPAAPVPTSPNP